MEGWEQRDDRKNGKKITFDKTWFLSFKLDRKTFPKLQYEGGGACLVVSGHADHVFIMDQEGLHTQTRKYWTNKLANGANFLYVALI